MATRAKIPTNDMFFEHAVFSNQMTSCGRLNNRVPTRQQAQWDRKRIEDMLPVLMYRLERPWKIYSMIVHPILT